MKYIILLFIILIVLYYFCNNVEKFTAVNDIIIEKFTEVDNNNTTIIKLGNKLKELQTNNGNLTDNIVATGSITSNGTIIVPIGTISPFFSTVIPDGWLLCNGNAIPAKYSNLIKIVGNNTPNLNGNLIVGSQGQGPGLSNKELLKGGGKDTHTLILDEIPNHNHTIDYSGDHQHSYVRPKGTTQRRYADRFYRSMPEPQSSGPLGPDNNAEGNHTHPIGISGNDEAHENMMPSHVLSYIIRAG